MSRQNSPATNTSAQNRKALRILIGGMLGLVIVMGIGRFAFTPILPLMQRDLGMSNTVAGWLAGLNYLGYLLGALFCSLFPRLLRFQSAAVLAVLFSLITTTAMGLTLSPVWWGGLRFAGGIATAVLFIIIAAEAGEALIRLGYPHWIGALYGGVGLGIALSGLIVPWLDDRWQWDGAWLGMGGLAVVLAVIGRILVQEQLSPPETTGGPKKRAGSLQCLRLLVAAYFFEGLGYIVTATFLVAIIAATPDLAHFAPYSWVAVGVTAIPSTLVWPLLARRFGSKRALLAAYLVQASGILVSIGADSVAEVLYAALTFGGTFMGIVVMTLTEGTNRLPGHSQRAAAILTASFGVGQIFGPILAGSLADLQADFTLPLLFATACVTAGSMCLLLDRHFVD